jgi:hypothetical protein
MPGAFVQRMRSYELFFLIRLRRGFKRGLLSAIKYSFSALLILLFFPKKQKMLMLFYAWFRKIDDIVDGEENVPAGFTVESYLDQKRCIANGEGRLLPEDILYSCPLKFFEAEGINMDQEIRDILTSMITEFFRKGKFISRQELENQMALQDRSVLKMISKASGSSTRLCENGMCGIFSKIDSLMDIREDVKKGILNIPLEDAVEYGFSAEKIMTADDLFAIPRFKEWYRKESRDSLRKWEEMRRFIKDCPEGFLLRIILNATKVEIVY